MNKKQLLELGIPEDQAEAIIVMHGRDIETTKSKLAELDTANQALNAQLRSASETIDSFKAMDVDTIKKTAEEYKAEAEQARQEAEDRIYQMQFEHSLDVTLREVGARNPKTVMALLDYDSLDLDDDGNVTGLDEQLLKVAEENPYLFEPSEQNPELVVGGQKHSVIGDATVIAARKAANLPIKE